MSCSDEYKFNPHSSTCYRIVKIKKNWDDAKTYCENEGEYFATFETLESVRWLTDTINATAGSYKVCFYPTTVDACRVWGCIFYLCVVDSQIAKDISVWIK